jgi:hypothetical protein
LTGVDVSEADKHRLGRAEGISPSAGEGNGVRLHDSCPLNAEGVANGVIHLHAVEVDNFEGAHIGSGKVKGHITTQGSCSND